MVDHPIQKPEFCYKIFHINFIQGENILTAWKTPVSVNS